MPDEAGPRLSETIVKEAVGVGLDSPMRESILDAVDEAEGNRRLSAVPLVGGALAIGAGIGYALGKQGIDESSMDVESLPIEDPKQLVDDEAVDEESDDGGDGSRLPRLIALVAVVGAIAYLKRRLSGDDEGWEPIEEIETSIDEGTSSVVSEIGDEKTAGERVAQEEDDADEAEASDETAEADEDEE
ncbi:hypothetical protein [Halovivax gelatinilyticus]|uniref:hypothetical protein n=1 Tax=Halovivax gelatinilyticus TaxID=2961597 RepID=UPI0020CA8006|nr:hypothetical protein [Halovivax gelatinilyticus]